MKTLEQLAREAGATEFFFDNPAEGLLFKPEAIARFRAACRAEALEEAAQDKADAERYRYIRNRPQSLCFMNTAQALGLDLRNVYVQRPEQLDAVIDAAIREMK